MSSMDDSGAHVSFHAFHHRTANAQACVASDVQERSPQRSAGAESPRRPLGAASSDFPSASETLGWSPAIHPKLQWQLLAYGIAKKAPFGPVLRMRTITVGLSVLLLVAGAVGGIWYEYGRTHEARAKQQEANGEPVKTAIAEARDVPIILRGLGRVEAFNSVAIRSRVEGHITKINFREGQTVHAGDLLIQIDPRPSQAMLDQERAVLAKDQAALANAKTDLQRYGKLLTRNITPEQQYTTQKSTVAQADATLQNDQAQVEAAELNVGYASITSPIDGVTGIRQVDVGNLVQVNSNNAATLATVTQIKPIYVVFTLPELNIQRILEAMRRGRLRVEAFDQADQKETAAGVLNLVDNAVDPTTGMVKLKAQFANEDDALWPGQFVNAHLVLEVIHNGVNVPTPLFKSVRMAISPMSSTLIRRWICAPSP